MAASSSSSKFCKHDTTLFQDDSGKPILFVMRPCKERQKISPLISHGGGEIKSKEIEGVECIRLAEEGSCIGGGKYISTKYITDCCEANKLLDLTKYSLNSFDPDLEHAAVIQNNPTTDYIGRKKYTLEEDLAIIHTLISSYRENDATGICVWQAMENAKITCHSYQSMRTRYLKQILPNIDKYDIPSHQKARLSGNPYKARGPGSPTLSPNESGLSGLKSSPASIPKNISSTKKTQSSPLKDKAANVDKSPKETPVKNIQLSPLKEPAPPAISDSSSKATPSRKTEASKNSPAKQHQPISSSTPKKRNLGEDSQCEVTPSKKTIQESAIPEDPKDMSSFNKESSSSDASMSDDELDKQLYELTEKNSSNQKRTHNKSKSMLESSVNEHESSPEDVSFHESSQNLPKLRSTAKVRKLDFVSTNTKNPTKKYVADSTTNTDVIENNKNESSREKLGNKTKTRGLRKSFSTFVMDERSSQTETEGSDGEENKSDSDLEELNEVVEMLKTKYNLTRDECLQVLWRNSGSVKDSIHWIEYGADMNGLPGWTKADDKVLGNPKDMQRLTYKFSMNEIHKRSLFLEDLTE